MSEFDGLSEIKIDGDIPTSSWSYRFTLRDEASGKWLHICDERLTSNAKEARFITAQQAEAIRRKYPELRGLKLRTGLGIK